MKPVKLVIEGVNSFTDAQTLDFEAAGRSNLFCISGKTGAGKTTIFDSIMLALYGKSSKGNLADVVNLSRMSARVTLDFISDGNFYSVDRTIKCRFEKNSNGEKTDKRLAVSDCTLYRNGEPLAKGEDATALITDIVGLEATEFKNVYLLEQGEYAEFLKKPPQRQLEAVGKIFSLMRFGDVFKLAGERARIEEAQAATSMSVITALGDVTPDKLAAETKALASLKAQTTNLVKDAQSKRAEIAALEKARDEFLAVREKQNAVRTLMLQLDEAGKNRFTAEQELAEFEKTIDGAAAERLNALREKLNELSKLNAIDREYASAMKDVDVKVREQAEKTELTQKADEQYKVLEKTKKDDELALNAKLDEFISVAQSTGITQTLKTAVAKLSADGRTAADIAETIYALSGEYGKAKELAKAAEERKDKNDKNDVAAKKQLEIIDTYNQNLTVIAAQKQAAENKATETQNALVAAQVCSHAAAVRAELHEGDRCPVCGGVYDGRAADGDGDVDARKADCEKAAEELKNITEKQSELNKHCDRAKTEYEHIIKEINDGKKEFDELNAKLDALGVDAKKYEKMLEILNESKILSEKAAISSNRASEQLPKIAALKAEANAAKRAIADASAKAENLKAELKDNCGKTDEFISEIKSSISALDARIKETEDRRKKLSGNVDAAIATAKAVQTSLDAAKAVCPVDMPPFDEEGYAEKREEAERINKHIAENEKDIAVKELEVKTLGEQCKTLADRMSEYALHNKKAAVYNNIAELTKGKKMLNFVAAEYISEFTAAASEILSELSDGKYTMLYDNTNGFLVSDYLNGGKPRKTDTLSGGELFLASLSVSIAIARTQSNGNNAFFFLDEGFGTLDDDLIDTVYDALEALSKDCLVGVITHSGALIDRMPSRVEVIEANDVTGSRIV